MIDPDPGSREKNCLRGGRRRVFGLPNFPPTADCQTNPDEVMAGARVDVNDKRKNPLDFVLWKRKSKEGKPSWDSPWGMGRPGWRINVPAMSPDIGEPFDIHGGGET